MLTTLRQNLIILNQLSQFSRQSHIQTVTQMLFSLLQREQLEESLDACREEGQRLKSENSALKLEVHEQ